MYSACVIWSLRLNIITALQHVQCCAENWLACENGFARMGLLASRSGRSSCGEGQGPWTSKRANRASPVIQTKLWIVWQRTHDSCKAEKSVNYKKNFSTKFSSSSRTTAQLDQRYRGAYNRQVLVLFLALNIAWAFTLLCVMSYVTGVCAVKGQL